MYTYNSMVLNTELNVQITIEELSYSINIEL